MYGNSFESRLEFTKGKIKVSISRRLLLETDGAILHAAAF
jgi:hypothetical protein